MYCNLDLAPENQNKSNLLNTILSLPFFSVIGRRRQLLEATRRTNFTTSTDERKLLHLGFCIAETGQHGYFSAYSNRCDHRVESPRAIAVNNRRGQRVTCQVGACNAGCTARPATPSASCNCKHCCLVLSWKAVAPRMCKPWNNLFAAASFIDSICIRNAVLLPSQSLVNQHPSACEL